LSQDFFKRISKREERNKIVFDFVHSQNEILTKIDGNIYKFKPTRLKPHSIMCVPTDPTHKPTKLDEDGVHSFFLGGEKYFFKGPMSGENGIFEITFDVDLFHLQRRQSYRIKIPESYSSNAKVLTINEKNVDAIVGKVQDLSAGGCAVELPSGTAIQLNDQVHVEIWLKNKKVFETPALVKYVGQLRDKGRMNKKSTVSFGVEFKPNEKFLEQRVFALTVELYRELYAKAS
jgi:hypothetical protein